MHQTVDAKSFTWWTESSPVARINCWHSSNYKYIHNYMCHTYHILISSKCAISHYLFMTFISEVGRDGGRVADDIFLDNFQA